MNVFYPFHFIRPEWLLAIIPLALFSWFLLRKKLFSHSWQSVVDPDLLPHLLIGKPGKSSRLPIILIIIGGLITIIALAGPVWVKLPQPVFKEQSALVILLDLSRSMDSADIKPSRLTRARHKISDILTLRKEGQTALIGYAAAPFTISPLTDDTATIDSLLPSLDTDIMPAQGSRADLALSKADELLKNAAISKGDILLITDDIAENSVDMFKQLHQAGHRISIIGIGTVAGGPITLASGGFLKDDKGAIVMPKLNPSRLHSIATQAGGRYSTLTADDTDIKHIIGLLDINRIAADNKETEMKADVWREEGPWLVLLLIPLAALAFRKGYLSILIFCVFPIPQPAEAISWNEIWLNDNQRAAQKLELNQNSEAANLFNHPDWKASAHYKAEEYEQALQQFESLDHIEAHYNRGNTLAKMGRFDEAIKAYDHVLEKDPQHADALHNKKQLEKQKQQENNSGQDNNEQQNNDDKNNSKNDDSSNNNQSDSQQNSKQSEQDETAQQQQSDQSKQSKNESDKDDSKKQSTKEESQQNKQEPEVDEQQMQSKSEPDSKDELSKQEAEQWLRRVPDDPGGLLRNKFKYFYQQQKQKNTETQDW